MNFAIAIIIAASFWGARDVQVPCQPVPVPGADAMMAKDAYGMAAPMSTVGCQILISHSGAWDRKAAPNWYCAEVVHEVGHVAGLAHTSTGIMAPELAYENIPYDCAHWRHYAKMHRIPLRF